MTETDWLDPKQQACGSCRWHDVAGVYAGSQPWAQGMGNVGFCRRNPPVILPWHHADRDDQNLQIEDEAFHSTWPITQEQDWCAEWLEDTRSYEARFGMRPDDDT